MKYCLLSQAGHCNRYLTIAWYHIGQVEVQYNLHFKLQAGFRDSKDDYGMVMKGDEYDWGFRGRPSGVD